MRSPLTQRSRAFRLPLALLLAGMLVTVAAVSARHHAADESAERRFEGAAADATTLLRDAISRYAGALADFGAYAVQAHPDLAQPDPAGLRDYGRATGLVDRYPGLTGVALVVPVAEADRPQFESGPAARGGAPLRITPAGRRDEYLVITGSTPGPDDTRGFDLGAAPERREAFERARDTGRPALSGKFTLLSDDALPAEERAAAFGLYVPLYRAGQPAGTVEQRRAALVGWAATAFRAGDLLEVVRPSRGAPTGFLLYDGDVGGRSLLARFPESGRPAADGLRTDTTVDLFGQRWTLRHFTIPGFGAHGLADSVVLVLVGWALSAALAWALTLHRRERRRLTRRLAAADRRAEDALAAREALFRSLVEHSQEMISRHDGSGLVTYASPSAETILGYRPEDLVGRRLADFVVGREDRGRFDQAVARVMAGGETVSTTYRARRADGAEIWLESSRHRISDDSMLSVTRDVTIREQARRRLQESEARFAALVEHSHDLFALLELDGTFRYVSPAAWPLLGADPAALLGEPLAAVVHPDDREAAEAAIAGDWPGRGPGAPGRRLPLRVGGPERGWRHAEVVASLLAGEAGPDSLVLNLRDVTDRVEAEEALRWRAHHDDLTGLPNRYALSDHLARVLPVAPGDGDVAVLFCDLDRFKVVNDSLGHAAGDALLVEVARRFEAAVRPGDTVARLGGDELVVVAAGLSGRDEALALAERIRMATAPPVVLPGGQTFDPSISIGVALTSDAHPDEVLRDADIALYRAKERGRDCCELFTPSLGTAAARRMGTEQLLRRALETDGVDVLYQPLIDLRTGLVVEIEALMRIKAGDGLLEPGEFLPVAEDTGLIVPLGARLLREACAEFARWRSRPEGASLRRLAVNLSARQLADASTADTVAAALADSGLPPEALCLELTEHALIEETPGNRRTLEVLTALGVGFALDDFGTGHASLTYARRLPADSLKIDQSFIRTLGASGPDREVVAAIIGLARGLGLHTVAEGVETPEQAELVAGLGCHLAQGYLFARPLDALATGMLLGRRLTPGTMAASPDSVVPFESLPFSSAASA